MPKPDARAHRKTKAVPRRTPTRGVRPSSPKAKAAQAGFTPYLYEGSSGGRRLGNYGMSIAGPNVAVESSFIVLRARSHEFMRNNPWARAGLNTLVSNLVGTGIRPSWHIPDNPTLAEEIQALWKRSSRELDADGLVDVYGQQALAGRCIVESGEVVGRFRNRFASDGLAVPLQVQLLEPDFIDDLINGPQPNGDYARLGIVFDGRGQKSAYWLRRAHPGDMTPMSGYGGYGSFPVNADEIMHCFLPERPGQIRGLPWLSSLILKLYELDQYDDAQLVKQKVATLLAGFMYDDGSGQIPGIDRGEDNRGQHQVEWEPATIQRLPPGVNKIEFANPPPVGDFVHYMNYQLRAVAKGLGITFEQLSGDFTNANFSLARLGILEFRRFAEMIQAQVFVHQFCQPMAERWLATAVATGKVKIPDFADNRRAYTDIAWQAPQWAFTDPVKDIVAAEMMVRDGFQTRGGIISGWSGDPLRVDRDRAEEIKREDELHLIYDTNPAKIGGTKGKAQLDTSVVANPSDNPQDAGGGAPSNAP